MEKVTLYCGALDGQEIKTTDYEKFSIFFRGYRKDIKRFLSFTLEVPEDRIENTKKQDIETLWEYKKKKESRENNLYTKG